MAHPRTMPPNSSLVRYLGCRDDDELRPCGYCKGLKPGNSDYAMWSFRLSPAEYQILMDRGWRRSGKYCYLPNASVTCCPAYTIRCDSSSLRLTRRQKRVIKSANKFLLDGTRPEEKKAKNMSPSSEMLAVSDGRNIDESKIEDAGNLGNCFKIANCSGSSKAQECGDHVNVPCDRKESESEVCKMSLELCQGSATYAKQFSNEKKERTKSSDFASSNKAKHLRMKKSIEKLMKNNSCSCEVAKKMLDDRKASRFIRKGNAAKTLEERMTPAPNSKHRITLKFVSTCIDCNYFDEKVLPVEHDVYRKYQCQIHNDSPEECSMKQFKRFLVDSPLTYEPFAGSNGNESPPVESDHIPGYGSYHMQYWLDETTLIGVSVIDITVHAFSSVYFFYDPDYSFLTLGTMSALNELRQVRILSQKLPELKYYYMGYYIDSCQKMRYKRHFKPSFLLCPEAKSWHKIDDVLPKLQESKYARLNSDPNAKDTDESVSLSHSQIQITLRKTHIFCFTDILACIEDETDRQGLRDEVNEYISVAGKQFARTVVYFMPI